MARWRPNDGLGQTVELCLNCAARTNCLASMPTRTLAIEIPEPLFEKVEALSAATARSHSQVVLDALKGHVALEAWQLSDIQAGIREADARDFASSEEVKAVFARYGA